EILARRANSFGLLEGLSHEITEARIGRGKPFADSYQHQAAESPHERRLASPIEEEERQSFFRGGLRSLSENAAHQCGPLFGHLRAGQVCKPSREPRSLRLDDTAEELALKLARRRLDRGCCSRCRRYLPT